jgi:hypothetical protein
MNSNSIIISNISIKIDNSQNMSEKTKKRLIIIGIVLAALLLYLLLLNGRYVATGHFAFDQWTGKYVDDCRGNIKEEGLVYKLLH